MMIRAILTVKGGVGKTTTAMNLAAGFAYAGRKTLLIDFDGQANLSNILLPDITPEKTITDVMAGEANIRDCIYPTRVRNLDIVPSSIYLFAIERRMLQETAGIQQFKLRRALKDLKEYDEIVIDNNPSLNMCSTNALCACDEVIIPTVADKGSEDGIVLTLDHCKEILEQIDGVDFNYMILITMLQRTTTDRLYCERIRENYGNNHVYQSQIRFQAKPVKDAGFQSGILIDNQKANVARDYRELISEVMGEA